ncbi:hypothetical protein JCM11251_006015 [Rhodosporidiobolus azoricus]
MVFGSLSLSIVTGGALLAQDEEPSSASSPDSERDRVEEVARLGRDDPSPASQRIYVSASSSKGVGGAFSSFAGFGEVSRPPFGRDDSGSTTEELYESADEGEEGQEEDPLAWLSDSRWSFQLGGEEAAINPQSRKNSFAQISTTLSTIIDTSPRVPDSATVPTTFPHLRLDSPEVAFGYACGSPSPPLEDGESFDDGAEADEDDDDAASMSSIGQLVRQSWRLSRATNRNGERALPVRTSSRGVVVPRASDSDDGLGINIAALDFGTSTPSTTVRPRVNRTCSYQPSSRPLHQRPSVIDAFPEVSTAPVSSFLSPIQHLPTSPPVDSGSKASSIVTSPSFSSTAPSTFSAASIQRPPSFLESDPVPDSRPPAPRSPQPPRTSSLAASSSSLPPASHKLNHRSSSESNKAGRQRLTESSSKSSRRLSSLITSGFDIVRSRTSSHNSADGDEKEVLRTSRRRSKTDGPISSPISAPLSSPQFPPAPYIRRATTPGATSASSISAPRSSGPPSLGAPTLSLTQSPMAGQTWRSTLTDKEYEQLVLSFGGLEMRRQEVIWELSETERSLVNGLRGVVQIFSLPLRTRSGAWIKGVPAPVSRLLDWLDEIVFLHSQISAALDLAREKQYPVVLRLAEAFLPFVQRLEVHQPYLVRFEAVTKLIDEMAADQDSDFGEYVRMQSSLPECGSMSLSSFLLKPVQRLMKYPLFFRQLCDLTPTGHPDHSPALNLLLHTDYTLRCLQEVKIREDEYEEAKVLQSRISGLPQGFQLAARDRRLIAHGVLRRVHVNDRDRAVLDMDAMARAGRRGAALRGAAPIPPSLSSPPTQPAPPLSPVDDTRPQSTISDSGSSSFTYASDRSSSSLGWTPPTTPGSALPTSPGFPHFRPDSMVSNASSTHSDDYTTAKAGSVPPSAFSNASTRFQTAQQQRLVKTKAKESSVHVFVFSDVIILATKHSDASKFVRNAAAAAKGGRKSGGKERAGTLPTYRVLEGEGVARVLSVADLSGKTEHDHLIEVDLLPIITGQDQFTPLSLSNTSLSTSVYFTTPSSSRTSSARSPASPFSPPLSPDSSQSLFAERLRWLQAFERSHFFALRASSFPSTAISPSAHTSATALNGLTAPADQSRRLSVGGTPVRSPSEQSLDALQRQQRRRARERSASDTSSNGWSTGEKGSAKLDLDSDGGEPDPAELEREERGWWLLRLQRVRTELEWAGPGSFNGPGASPTGGPLSSWHANSGVSGGSGAMRTLRRKDGAGGTVRASRVSVGGVGGGVGNPGLGIESFDGAGRRPRE